MSSLTARFFSANDHRVAEAKQRMATEQGTLQQHLGPKAFASHEINEAVRALAAVIDKHLPSDRSEGDRQKSIALTHLEDVQMHANRGIFAPTSN